MFYRDCFSVQFYYGCNGVSILVLVPFKSQYWNDRLKRTIIWFGPLTFAVYLIHDNSNVRNILWKILPMEQLYAGGIMMYLGGLIVIAPTILLSVAQ